MNPSCISAIVILLVLVASLITILVVTFFLIHRTYRKFRLQGLQGNIGFWNKATNDVSDNTSDNVSLDIVTEANQSSLERRLVTRDKRPRRI